MGDPEVVNIKDRLRERILARQIRRQEVYVPEWDVTLWVPEVAANQRKAIEALANADDGLERVVLLATDEAGEPIFSEADLEALGAQPLGALNRVATAFFDVNGWTAEAARAAGKGSSSTATATSPSVSAKS